MITTVVFVTVVIVNEELIFQYQVNLVAVHQDFKICKTSLMVCMAVLV